MLFDIVRLGSETLGFTDVLLIIVSLLLLAPIRLRGREWRIATQPGATQKPLRRMAAGLLERAS